MGLSGLLSPLQSLLNTFQPERHYTDEKKDAALLAINEALIETKKYLEECADKKCSDRDREFKLSALWSNAAVKARYASNELASRLQNKSLYWSGTLEWSREEVIDKKIDLESIQNEILSLLNH